MCKVQDSKLKIKLKNLEKRLDDFQLNVQTCHSEHQDSISNQTKKIANLEKKLQALKIKLKKGNQKIKLLQTKLEAPDDTQSQKSQDTRISEPEVQSCDKAGVAKRRLNYDVLAASEFSRSQISFTRNRPTRNPCEDDFLSTIIDQSTIQSSVSLSEESREIGSKVLTKETTSIDANATRIKKRKKISNLVETWMEESNILESIGKGAEEEGNELELIVQKEQEPKQNKMNDQVINKALLVNDQNEDTIVQQETVISTGPLNENTISNNDAKKNKSNKRKLSAKKAKENTTKPTLELNDISKEIKEQEEKESTEKSKKGVYVCEYCTESFMFSLSLRRHLETSHTDVEKEYICQVCKRSFSKPDDFYRHVKTHQAPKNDLKCSFCSKVFHRKHILKNHEMIHRNPKLYKCKKCAKKFFSRGPLQKHQVQCLGKTQIFTCGTCESTFPNRKTWKNHLKKHNKDIK